MQSIVLAPELRHEFPMSAYLDDQDRALLERVNEELSSSLQRCQGLLHGYEAKLIALRFHPRKSDRLGAFMTEGYEGFYYAVREHFERAMSRHATDWRAAAAHAEMADRYEALAVVFGAKRAPEFPVDYL